MAIDFVDGPAALSKIRSLLSRSKCARIAVAYWGAGAIDRIGLEHLKGKDARIVCDLLSGACKPSVVKELQDMFGWENIKTCDRLHAKAWITDHGAVIGSSNASANGLGDEGVETIGLIEANIYATDSALLQSLNQWFDTTVWQRARLIKEVDFERACELWKRRRGDRPLRSSRSLLAALKDAPASLADRNLLVWLYRDNYRSNEAEAELKLAMEELEDKNLDCWEGADAPPGAHILDFHLQRNGKAKFTGLWRVLSENQKRTTKNSDILLCKEVKSFEGLPLGEKVGWEAAATEAAKTQQDEWCIEDFAQFLV